MSYQDRSIGRFVGSWALATCIAGCGAADAGDGEGSAETTDATDVAATEQAVIPGATVTRISTLRTIQPSATVTVLNSCPAGSVVVGGGYIAANSSVWVNASRPFNNGWQVIATNRNTAHARTINTEVECLVGTNATRLAASSLSQTIGGLGGVRCLVATCPTGAFAVNGGWTTNLGGLAYLSRPLPDGRSWQTCVKNHNPLQAIAFTAHATCLQGVSGSTVTTVVSESIPAHGSARIDSGRCGQGLLLGGGAFDLEDGDLEAVVAATNRSFQDPLEWQTQVTNPNGTPMVMSGSSVCLNLFQ